jgi:anti-sigma regulatory factor (Ser/Thr protein kinase)
MTHKPMTMKKLDQPIPPQALNKIGNWITKADRYPIYSPTWFRYRCYRYAVMLAVLGFFMLLVFLSQSEAVYMRPYFVFLGVAIQLLAARWIAVRICLSAISDKTKLLLIIITTCAGIFGGLIVHNLPHPNPLGYYLPATTFLPEAYLEFRDGKMRAKVPQLKQVEKIESQDTSEEIPFYPTSLGAIIYFLLMCYWGGVLDVWRYFKQKPIIELAFREEEIARYKSERNLAELKLSVLASQVEPHFLFNTLTGVRSAMVNDPERGFQMIDHLVDYLRATIPRLRSDGTSSVTSVESQLEIARAYLEVMRLRLQRLSYSIDCPEHLRSAKMPPLMLISLVENAIKHGIEPKKGNVNVRIEVREHHHEDQHRMSVSVTDDGVGFGMKSTGSGIGLSNIRERLEQMYGEQAELQISAGDINGLVATICFPMTPQEHVNLKEGL